MARSKVRVEMSDAGMRELYQEIASKLEKTDAAFRAKWEGKPVAEILPHVKGALDRVGSELPEAKRREFAEAVSKTEPFVWLLG